MYKTNTQDFFALPALYAQLAAEERLLGDKLAEAHKAALQSFVANLIALKECYNKEQAQAVYTAYSGLPESVQEGLLNSRRYNGNVYITLGQFARPHGDKGVFNLTKSSTVEILELFYEAENACLTPKPEKGAAKSKDAQATEAIMESTPCFVSQFTPRAPTQAEKNLKAVRAAFTRLSTLISEANKPELLIRLETLAPDVIAAFAKMVTDDAAIGLPDKDLPATAGDDKQAQSV